jgi:hypothetical protein
MTNILTATFDGFVLRPNEPLLLQPNTQVKITLEVEENATTDSSESLLDVAESLHLQDPPDWSARRDDFLYNGTNGSAQ